MAFFSSLSLDESRTWVVAEISGNHGGNIEICTELLKVAKDAGADAVKLQTYTPDTLTLDVNSPDFLIPSTSPWARYRTQYNLYQQTFTPWEWHSRLFQTAKELDLICFSSPFDESAVALLESLDCPVYKLASPEINHIPLIRSIARTGKPIIFSLGVATESELDLAIDEYRKFSSAPVAILHCDTSYPARLNYANLRQISYLQKKYPFTIGYSDHTLGPDAAVISVALGAKIIEKHIRLDSSGESPDTFFSTTQQDFKAMVELIRSTEGALGKADFRQQESMKDFSVRRSIYPKVAIRKGETVTSNMIAIVRPGFGIDPKFADSLIGSVAKRSINKGERINLDDFELLPTRGRKIE